MPSKQPLKGPAIVRRLPWPANLYTDLGLIPTDAPDYKTAAALLPPMSEQLLLYILAKKDAILVTTIELRYQSHLTLDEIAAQESCTREMIRIRLNKALRILQDGDILDMVRETPIEHCRKIGTAAYQNGVRKGLMQNMTDTLIQRLRSMPKVINENTLLDTMTGFEVRTKNVFSRYKLRTIGDLLQYTPAQLLTLRNAGEKTVANIQETLAAYGYSLPQGKNETNTGGRPSL